MSSEPRRGRADAPARAIEAAIRLGRRAISRVENDTLQSYLENEERQDSIERLLLRFGEALKAIPSDIRTAISPTVEWDKPIRFRDLAAHWYEDGLDHELIWNVLRYDLPPLVAVLEAYSDEAGLNGTC